MHHMNNIKFNYLYKCYTLVSISSVSGRSGRNLSNTASLQLDDVISDIIGLFKSNACTEIVTITNSVVWLIAEERENS